MSDKSRIYRGQASHTDWGEATADCTIRVLPGSLRGECESGVIEMPLEGLEIGCCSGKPPHFTFSHPQVEGWSLQTIDRAILEALLQQRSFAVRKQVQEITRRLDDMKRLKTTIAFVVGFAFLAVVAMNLGGWLVSLAVHRMPVKYEVEIGRKAAEQVAEIVDVVAPAPTNEIKAELVRILGKDLATRYTVIVQVYHSPLPNAFVAPGGYFYVSTGLLSLMETPEELAGILAHEAAHLKLRHGLRTMVSEQGQGLLFKLLFGGSRNLASALSSAGDALVGLSYSRELEMQADDMGWDMLLAANINPRGILTAFEKLQSIEGDSTEPRMLQTHPPTRERVERMRKKWDRCPKKDGFVALQKIEWKQSQDPTHEFLKLLQKNRHRK
jgi:Zn-dependent protease with chaperone function